MARVFNEARHRRRRPSGPTARTSERQAALRDLAARRVNVVFSVDLFNEGVDVPAVDTLLLLRPTDSPTLFLQQLGRGLRKPRARPSARCSTSSATTAGSSASTAASGAARRQPQGPRASRSRQGFPFLPAGCHMELDRVARDIVLRSIREAVPVALDGEGRRAAATRRAATRRRPRRVPRRDRPRARRRLRRPARAGRDLRADAGLAVARAGPARERCCGGPSAACSTSTTASASTPTGGSSTPDAPPQPRRAVAMRDRRLLRMLVGVDRATRRVDKQRRLAGGLSPCSGSHPQVRAELRELLEVLGVAHRPRPRSARHAPGRARSRCTPATRASRSSPPSASASGAKVAPWQTGVYWAKDGERRPARLHARQDQRPVLADHPLPRLRHQPRPHPLGEPVDHPSRQRRPACATSNHAEIGHAASCSSPACGPTTAPSGSSAPPTTSATSRRAPMAITWRLAASAPGRPVRSVRRGGGVGARTRDETGSTSEFHRADLEAHVPIAGIGVTPIAMAVTGAGAPPIAPIGVPRDENAPSTLFLRRVPSCAKRRAPRSEHPLDPRHLAVFGEAVLAAHDVYRLRTSSRRHRAARCRSVQPVR